MEIGDVVQLKSGGPTMTVEVTNKKQRARSFDVSGSTTLSSSAAFFLPRL